MGSVGRLGFRSSIGRCLSFALRQAVVFGIMGLVLGSAAATGQDCFDYAGRGPELIGSTRPDIGPFADMEANENWLFVVGVESGFHTISLSESRSPRLVASLPLEGRISGMTLLGEHAFIAAGRDGLIVVDLSSPSEPSVVGSLPSLRGIYQVHTAGDYVCTLLEGEFWIVDASDPTSPRAVGSIELSNDPRAIEIVGELAYVVGRLGLVVVSLEDPDSPTIVSTSQDVSGFKIVSHDGLFYVGDRDLIQLIRVGSSGEVEVRSEFQIESIGDLFPIGAFLYAMGWVHDSIIDFEAGESPRIVATLPDRRWGVNIAGTSAGPNSVFVSDSHRGLSCVDLLDPTNPQVDDLLYYGGRPKKVEGDGNLAFTIDEEGQLILVDLTDARAPEYIAVLGSFHTSAVFSGDYLFAAVAVRGGSHGDKVVVYDVRDPSRPSAIGEIAMADRTDAIASVGTHIVVFQNQRLLVLDVASPQHPVIVAESSLPRSVGSEVSVWGDQIVVASYGEVYILDFTDPVHPRPLGTISVPSPVLGLWLSGVTLCVAVDGTGLYMIDVSDPEIPVHVGTVSGVRHPGSVTGSGSSAFLADPERGIHVIDIVDPRRPVWTHTLEVGGVVSDLDADDGHLYVASGRGEVSIFDVTSVDYPIEGFSLEHTGVFDVVDVEEGAIAISFTEGAYLIELTDAGPGRILDHLTEIVEPRDAVRLGGHVLVARKGGLTVIQVRYGNRLEIVGEIELSDQMESVVVAGSVAYCAGSWSGIYVVDVADPEDPSIRARLEPSGTVRSVAMLGEHFLLAAGSHEIHVLAIGEDGGAELLSSLELPENVQGVSAIPGAAVLSGEHGEFYSVDLSDPSTPRLAAMLEMPENFWSPRISSTGSYAYVGRYVVDVTDPAHPVVAGDLGRVVDRTYRVAVLPNFLAQCGSRGIAFSKRLCDETEVWPGDANGDGVVDLEDIVPIGRYLDARGESMGGGIDWAPRSLDYTWPVVEATFADCDGNGVVEGNDIVAVIENWNQPFDGHRPEDLCQLALDFIDDRFEGRPRLELRQAVERHMLLGGGSLRFRASLVSPNPTTGPVVIEYVLPEGASRVELEVYDAGGRLVDRVTETVSSPGTGQIRWGIESGPGTGAPSGVYWYVVSAGAQRAAGRFLVLK